MNILAVGLGEGIIGTTVIFLSLVLIGLVLLQKNRGSGLSGAFGGVGGNSAFGTKTGDFLTWVTVGVTAAFVILMVIGNWVFIPDYESAAVAAPPRPQAPQPVTPLSGTPSNAPSPAPPTPTPALPRPAAPSNQPNDSPAGASGEAAPKAESPAGEKPAAGTDATETEKKAEEPAPASPSELP
ncbi:MAG: preprotein translocase subunit SecG [Phycisphaerae bacterium]|nr:preprotein translocase subunit SecG [Phycisphaerae bacterium]NUQ45959.1 preprotein translocase subunit SecG [Phycisphaerae bacterium]